MGAKIRVHESFEPLLADQASPEHLPERKRNEKKKGRKKKGKKKKKKRKEMKRNEKMND